MQILVSYTMPGPPTSLCTSARSKQRSKQLCNWAICAQIESTVDNLCNSKLFFLYLYWVRLTEYDLQSSECIRVPGFRKLWGCCRNCGSCGRCTRWIAFLKGYPFLKGIPSLTEKGNSLDLQNSTIAILKWPGPLAVFMARMLWLKWVGLSWADRFRIEANSASSIIFNL